MKNKLVLLLSFVVIPLLPSDKAILANIVALQMDKYKDEQATNHVQKEVYDLINKIAPGTPFIIALTQPALDLLHCDNWVDQYGQFNKEKIDIWRALTQGRKREEEEKG